MDFIGTGKRLDDVDLPNIGFTIGVGEDEIHAVLDVECRGRGFDRMNRPAMLFEPHIFYRELPENLRALAVQKGLAYPRWRRGGYPAESYTRLKAAMKIHKEAALRSCSWGLGQIMGFNYRLAGYPSAGAMVADFLLGEKEQLNAMVRFIKNAGLADELQRHDWRGFASGYNGKSYAKHDYHGRLKRAFDKWSRIKDTPRSNVSAMLAVRTEPPRSGAPWWFSVLDAVADFFETQKGPSR